MEQARMLSTKHTVTAMKKNCIHNEVKAVLRAHTFDNMDDAISAFIETSNEISEEKHSIMYYQNYAQRGGNRGGGNFRGRNYNRGDQRYYNNGGSSNYNSNNSRGGSNRGGSNRGNGRHNNNNQVRVTQGSSENSQAP
ncbi:N66 matrix protein-like [Drosophila sulfurigaster albostrigata]|uniref:N66 matrix protein-like n=1 Tax=Drosophila sulfurigaster albostrigata TaxID=89887 RepID=UPI002D21997E|nr:N66 matrix protein-like [Drosophila sulfurigaster albostrigata]